MRKVNLKNMGGDHLLTSKKSKYFLGEVVLNDVSDKISITGQKVYNVYFKRGARTKLHHHQGGQILLITAGVGMLVLYRKMQRRELRVSIRIKSRLRLRQGDIVFIPKGTIHWHGAIGNGNFAHVAFNGFSANGVEAKTFWYDSDFKTYALEIN